MKIQNTGEILRSGYANAVRNGTAESSGKSVSPVQPGAPAARGDKVQISEAGRALAAQASGSAEESERAQLSAERISQVRQRILEGAYNNVGVVEEVARRMLERGDI